ncbi:hypothetical protein NX059_012396 [Plenodomus lindquistii]|nr:hypothetical protein NX059_012396 [Plenodomus lindquistii]
MENDNNHSESETCSDDSSSEEYTGGHAPRLSSSDDTSSEVYTGGFAPRLSKEHDTPSTMVKSKPTDGNVPLLDVSGSPRRSNSPGAGRSKPKAKDNDKPLFKPGPIPPITYLQIEEPAPLWNDEEWLEREVAVYDGFGPEFPTAYN